MKSELFESLGKLFLRLSVGGLMIFHGIHKLIYGHKAIESMLAGHGLPKALVYGVPVGEVLAPLMLILGIWSRLSALTVAFTMVMSMYLAFGSSALELGKNGAVNAELNLLFLFGALAIACLGAGRYSVSGGNGTWD